jgi:cyclohexanone monooxygenase
VFARVGFRPKSSSGVQVIPMIAREARELTVFQRAAAYVAPAHNGPLDATFEARIKSDYRGFRERNRRMRLGFGSELPPNMVAALAVSAEERDARFEERWQTGGFAFFGAFYDIMLDERANAFACGIRSRQNPRDRA